MMRRVIRNLCAFAAATLVPAAAAAQAGWVQQAAPTSENLHGVSFAGPQTGWAVGAAGTILHTTDGGQTWSAQTSGSADILRSVSFADASTGIAVGSGMSILVTDDGGSTWEIIQEGYIGTLHGIQMLDTQRAFAAGVNAIFQPVVAWTTDGGQTWGETSFYIDNSEATLYDIHFVDASTGFAVARIFDGSGAIVRTTNGGASWQTVLATPQGLTSVEFVTPEVGIVAGDGGRVYWTTDGGDSWPMQETGPAQTLWGAAIPHATIATVSGASGTIRRSVNGGATWHEQASGTSVLLWDVVFPDVQIGYAVGDGGTILKTETGGYEPSGVEDTPLPAAVVLHPVEPNPMRGAARLRFWLARETRLRLDVYDAGGRLVRRLAAGSHPAGTQAVWWDGRNAAGQRVRGGVYLVRLKAVIGGMRLARSRSLIVLDP